MIFLFSATFLELVTNLKRELSRENSPCARAKIYLDLGELYSAYGDFQKALDSFSKARYLSKKNNCDYYEEAFYGEIVALTSLQKYSQALGEIKIFLKKFPYSDKKSWIYLEAARCYYGLGQYREASANLKAVAITYPDHPSMPDILLLLGDSLKNLGRCAEAFANYERIVKDYPQTIPAEQAKKRMEVLKMAFPDCYLYFERRKEALMSAWKFYYLQAGSFLSLDSALKVKSLLQKRLGYPAHIESVVIGNKTFHRVIVGPVVGEGEVKEVVSNITSLLKMKPVLLRE